MTFHCAHAQLMVVSARARPAGNKKKTSAAAKTRVGSRVSVIMTASCLNVSDIFARLLSFMITFFLKKSNN